MRATRIEKVRKAIKEKYWPRVDGEGKVLPPGKDGTYHEVKGEYDPNTVWVGPLLDGLVELGIFKDRRQAKTFFWEVGEALTGDVIKGGKFNLTLERGLDPKGEWPYSGGFGPKLALTRISGTGLSSGGVEPGDITNSPPQIKAMEDDLWEGRPELDEWDITILTDARFGLHRLGRGDRIVKEWWDLRRKRLVRETYILRPASEGSSRINEPSGDSQVTRV